MADSRESRRDPPAADNAGASAGTTATAADTGDELPFTGLELGVFAIIGAGLVGTGLVLRRTIRTQA